MLDLTPNDIGGFNAQTLEESVEFNAQVLGFG